MRTIHSLSQQIILAGLLAFGVGCDQTQFSGTQSPGNRNGSDNGRPGENPNGVDSDLVDGGNHGIGDGFDDLLDELKGNGDDIGTGLGGNADTAKEEFLTEKGQKFLTNCDVFLADPDRRMALTGGPPLKYTLRELTKGGHLDANGRYQFGFHALQYRKAYEAELNNDPGLRAAALAELAQKQLPEWSVTETLHNIAGSQNQKDYTKTFFMASVEKAEDHDCKLEVERTPASTDEFHNQRKLYNRGGCFASGTQILMSDMTSKPINNLQPTDMVYNPILKRSFAVKELRFGPELNHGLIEVGYGDQMVVVTATHPFKSNSGMKQARELTKADALLAADGSFQKITHLHKREVDPDAFVYNLRLEGDANDIMSHMVVADGILAGDLHLQETLEKSRQNSLDKLLAGVSLKSL